MTLPEPAIVAEEGRQIERAGKRQIAGAHGAEVLVRRDMCHAAHDIPDRPR